MPVIFPNVWGQGALFAHSGIDGENLFTDDFAGYLSGDRVGVQFHTEPKMELYFALDWVKEIRYDAVASDYIDLFLHRGCGKAGALRFAFASQHVIVGRSPAFAAPCVSAHAPAKAEDMDGVQVVGCQATYCALCSEEAGGEIRFALAYAHDAKTAAGKARAALGTDMEAVFEAKRDFFARLPKLDAPEAEQALFAKCCSIMKSQFYSAQAPFAGLWTTPDRLPHRSLWLWDSVFHSLGNRHIDKAVSLRSLNAVLETIQEDGLIPHMTNPTVHSEITQPPILAWGYQQYYKETGDLAVLAAAYDKLKAYLLWNKKNRDMNGNNLFEWALTDNIHCRCDECGMDNSPRFDAAQPMDAIDFSCYMAHDVLCMADIAKTLGNAEDAAMWTAWYEAIKQAVNENLWDEADGLYYDKLVADGSFYKVKAVSSFLPLFAGIASEAHARRLVQALLDPEQFGTPFGIPSIAKNDVTFGTDMWRGPVWINFNYMIAQGLRDYGYEKLADKLIDRTLEVVGFWYQQDGVTYEYYDSIDKRSPSRLNRKKYPIKPYLFDVRISSIRDYGWTATLTADLLMQKYGK